MRLIYLLGLGVVVNAESHYIQSENIEYDRIEVIYLPGNTCQIKADKDEIARNYRDYVRGCLNNRHLRLKIDTNPPN